MDFYEILDEELRGLSKNPYAARKNNEWIEGFVSIDFLNEKFGHLTSAEEMIKNTKSEGLKLYFSWLKKQGILN